MNVSNGGTHPSQVELVLAGGQTGHILYAGAVASADLQESTDEKTDGSHGRTLDMHLLYLRVRTIHITKYLMPCYVLTS